MAQHRPKFIEKKIAELEAQLKQLEGNYDVTVRIQEIYSGKGRYTKYEGIGTKDAAFVQGGRRYYYDGRASEAVEAAEKPKVDPPDLGGGSTSSSSGGSKGSGKDPVKEGEKLAQQLQRDIALLKAKTDLEKQLLQVKYKQADTEEKIRATAAAAQQAALIEQNNTKARLASIQAIEKYTNQATSSAEAFLAAGRAETELLAKQQAYMTDGIEPSLARQLASIDQQTDAQLQQLDTAIAFVESQLLNSDIQDGLLKTYGEQLEKLKGIRAELEGDRTQKKNRAKEAAEGEGNKIREYVKQLEDDLNDFDGMVISLAGTIESELGSAMSSAITGIIDGTQTAQEAFSQMFKNIGAAFIDMATQMIAKALVMKALGILGAGNTGFNMGTTPFGAGGGSVGGIGTLGPNFGIAQRANGGRLGVGMPSFVGERGPEVFIPDTSGTVLSNEEIFKATRNAMKRSTGNSNNVVQSEGRRRRSICRSSWRHEHIQHNPRDHQDAGVC